MTEDDYTAYIYRPTWDGMTYRDWVRKKEQAAEARLTAIEMETKVTPSERQANTKVNRSRKEVALARLKELEKELAFLARFPDDTFDEHTVLMTWKTYTKEFPTQLDADLRRSGVQGWTVEKRDVTYTYVLLKANGQWWMTGQNGHQINGASWDKVVEFVDEDDLVDVRTGKSVMLDADPNVMHTDPAVHTTFAQVRHEDDPPVVQPDPPSEGDKVQFMRPTLKTRRDEA